MAHVKKSYGQFCGLARSLDHVGDRWTLLMIRELLIGPATYGGLLRALSGIPTNLLAERLRELEADGLLTRGRDDEDGRRVLYRLTPLGGQLEPALLALIRWGGHWMASGQGQDRFDPRWAVLAVRALLEGRRPGLAGSVEIEMDGEVLTATAAEGEPVQVEVGGRSTEPGASVRGPAGSVLGLLSGQLAIAEASRRGVRITGRRLVRQIVGEPTAD